MIIRIKTLQTASLGAYFFLVGLVSSVQAQIENPAVGNFGNDADKAADGTLFVEQFIRLWRNLMTIGALMVIFFFIWGALQWISSSGDKSKLEAARNRMLQAAIGLFILVSSFVIIGFIGNLLFGTEFELLQLEFLTPE